MAYYIHENGSSSGPYSIGQLLQKQILPSTPIWKEGLPDWTIASHLPELQGGATQIPPPFQPVMADGPAGSLQEPGKTGLKPADFVRVAVTAVLLVIAALALVSVFSHPHPVYTFTPPLIADPEHAYPSNYLSPD